MSAKVACVVYLATIGVSYYFGFVDLEKAFDRVPREVISWAMRSWELKNG